MTNSADRWSSLDEAFSRLKSAAPAFQENYLGFYSSWLGGYFREAWAMMLPMDDHGFHRGDGVFEAVRIHSRAYFDLRAHLRRMGNSARAIGMTLPKPVDEIEAICVRLGSLTGAESGILRLFVTRGPGGFSPSPSEVVGHQIYAAITRMKPPAERLYDRGARAMTSAVAAKEERWSQIKSCNYLQNVLMKMDCADKGFDFALSVDGQGRVCEGSTENFLIVSAEGEVVVPHFDYTLRGTTVSLVMKIAETLKTEGLVRDVRLGHLSLADVRSAREAAFVGTTLGVLPVASLDEKAIGTGAPGEVCRRLHAELMRRMSEDAELRTPF
ncbi:MAG: hypothetical protein HC902_11670 [Calothrix sp. SM1_5_4]|nr:hypothetical protein [Calothrix sp. SM1_5_4]